LIRSAMRTKSLASVDFFPALCAKIGHPFPIFGNIMVVSEKPLADNLCPPVILIYNNFTRCNVHVHNLFI